MTHFWVISETPFWRVRIGTGSKCLQITSVYSGPTPDPQKGGPKMGPKMGPKPGFLTATREPDPQNLAFPIVLPFTHGLRPVQKMDQFLDRNLINKSIL